MHLNIKNDEAHSLARDLAALTGESMTAAVTAALRERLERLQRDKSKRFQRLTAIAEDCARRLKASGTFVDINELLYDEKGMPK